MRFRVAFADEDPEVLVLQRFHFLRVPLAGDKELCGKEVRILIADGDVCHAALGLAGAVDAVRVDGVRVRDIVDEIGDEGEALCPNVFIRRHHAGESTSSGGYWTARTMEGCFFCSSSDAQTVAPLP